MVSSAASSACALATPRSMLRRNWLMARNELPVRETSLARLGASDMRRIVTPDAMSSRSLSIPVRVVCIRAWLLRRMSRLLTRMAGDGNGEEDGSGPRDGARGEIVRTAVADSCELGELCRVGHGQLVPMARRPLWEPAARPAGLRSVKLLFFKRLALFRAASFPHRHGHDPVRG